MKSVLQKIITSHRFSLILLLLVKWTVCLLFNYLPRQLMHSLFIGSSFGFGIALLLVYYNKTIGVNEQGQQHGSKVRQLITLAGFAAIAFLLYRLFSVFSCSERSYDDWLPMVGWSVLCILVLIRSGKYSSTLYHLLTFVFSTGSMVLLYANPPLNPVFFDAAIILPLAYYMLLIVSFNVHKPLIRGAVLGLGLLTAGFIPLFWLLPVLVIVWLNEARFHFMHTLAAFLIIAGSIVLLAYAGRQYLLLPYSTVYSNIFGLPFLFTILSAVVMLLLYFRIRRLIDYHIFLMGSFKMCMALFILLNWLPPGLMLVDLFVSIAILAETGKYHFAGTIKEV